MSLHLTPKLLETSYEVVRAAFPKWKLPDGDSLEFRVIGKCQDRWGHFRESTDGTHEISISIAVKSLDLLQRTMAHEVAHLRQHMLGHRDNHGAGFTRIAKQMCRKLGYAQETF